MNAAIAQPAICSATGQVACSCCALRRFCAPPGLGLDPAALPAEVRRRRLRPGEYLYSRGAPQSSLYAVRAGFLKSCAPLSGGRSQVLAFHIMGDLLGLDALASGTHRSDAVALNACEVCEITLDQAERMMQERTALAAHMRSLLSGQVADALERMVALGTMSARQRVAGYILDLAGRWSGRGYSPNEFDLCMTRKEMGSYLGLTFETVSRMLSLFDAREWIAIDGRKVRIRDRAALQSLLAAA
jgi:CRP/FNR family transcriptional regulator, anaerobic regulatory protein